MANKQPLFDNFDTAQQTIYEEQLIEQYGDRVINHINESKAKVAQWTQDDWKMRGAEFDAICKDLTTLLEKRYTADNPDVQAIIRRHYTWIKHFWTPNKESYAGLGLAYTSPEWAPRFTPYHPALAQFFADAIRIFATK